MSTLLNKYISDTYTGVLHAGGTAIPSSSKAIIYDGAGNQTDLELGRNGNGVAITGPLSVSSNGTISGTLTVAGVTTINDNASVTGTFTVGGTTTINDLLDVNGNTTISGNLTVDGSTATINATLAVNGNITTTGNVTISDGTLNVSGTATVGDLKAGDLFYPNTTGTPGDLLVMNAAGDAIVRASQDSIIISGDDDVITRTTYLNRGIGDPILVDLSTSNDAYASVDLSSYVSAGTKAIIAYLDMPEATFGGEDVSYIIYASRNGQNSTAVPIIRVVSGSDDNNDESFGGSCQFQSRISTSGRLYFRLDEETTQGDNISKVNWRLHLIAEQR